MTDTDVIRGTVTPWRPWWILGRGLVAGTLEGAGLGALTVVTLMVVTALTSSGDGGTWAPALLIYVPFGLGVGGVVGACVAAFTMALMLTGGDWLLDNLARARWCAALAAVMPWAVVVIVTTSAPLLLPAAASALGAALSTRWILGLPRR